MAHVSHSNRKQRFRRLSYTRLGEQVITFKREILYCFLQMHHIFPDVSSFLFPLKCFISLVFELLYALKVINSRLKISGIPLQPGPPRFSILYSINGIKHISPLFRKIFIIFCNPQKCYICHFLVHSVLVVLLCEGFSKHHGPQLFYKT